MARRKHRYKGEKFASKAEMTFAQWMDKTNIPWLYEPVRYPYQPPTKTRIYTPDFELEKKDGSKMVIEYKGYLRPQNRTTIKCYIEQYPEIDFRMIFMNANKPIYKGAKTTYGVWCDKLGILWSELTIPKDWLREVKRNAKSKKVKH